MKPALTHLAAALVGGALVFLATGPRRPSESGHTPQNHRVTPKSERVLSSLANRGSEGRRDGNSPRSDPQTADPDDFTAFMEELEARVPTRAELEAYLEASDRSPDALLGAALIAKDATWLREALTKGPDIPQVLFAGSTAREFSPAERLKWSKRLHQLHPDNALASYLLGSRLIESGATDDALAVLRSSLAQSSIDDFFSETILTMEDAYRATTGNALGAKLQSTWGLPLPYASDLHSISQLLGEERETLAPEDAHDLRTLQASIGLRIAEDLPTSILLTEVIGLGLQMTAMSGLPDDSPSPFDGLSVSEANDSLRNRKNEIRAAISPSLETFATLPPDTFASYVDRVRLLGEFEAIRWLNTQTPDPDPE